MSENKPKVFISYSWDSVPLREKVLDFANTLRENGVECIIDQFKDYTDENNDDWKDWIDKHLISSDTILVLCTENYKNCFENNNNCKGKGGVKWEADIIRTLMGQNKRILPIFFEPADEEHIPTRLNGKSRYLITKFNLSDSNYISLYSIITNQNNNKPKNVGLIKNLLSVNFDDIKNSKEMTNFKNLIKNMNIRAFKKTAFNYLPKSYRNNFPSTIANCIDKLLEIGVLPNTKTIPILSTLRNLKEHTDITILIDLIKNKLYSDIEESDDVLFSDCNEVSLLIKFSEKNEEQYHIDVWQYEHGEFNKIYIPNEKIDIYEKQSKKVFLSYLYKYIEENITIIFGNNIFIEFILPPTQILENYKEWMLIEGGSLLRKYKVLFRLETRFKRPQEPWIQKWDKFILMGDKNFSKNACILDITKYNNNLSNNVESLIIKRKIGDTSSLFKDVIDFGIPVVLLPLTENYTEQFEDTYKKTSNKSCKDCISNHIMTYHNQEDSNIVFIYDNPNLIPNEIKEPELNLYGY